MLSYNYELTDEDYILFNYHHTMKTKSGKLTLLFTRLALPVMLLIVLIFKMCTSTNMDVIIFFLIMIIADILWVCLSGLIVKAGIKSGVKNLSKNGKLPYSGEGTITLDENGICDKGETAVTSVKWDEIERVMIIKKTGIYVFYNAASGFIFSGRLFEKEEDRQQLIDFIAQHVAEEKIKNYRK